MSAIGAYFRWLVVSADQLPTPLQALVGGKLYVFMWGLFFLLVVSPHNAGSLERVWRGCLS